MSKNQPLEQTENYVSISLIFMTTNGLRLSLFGLTIFVLVYLLSFAINRRFKKIHWSRALLYIFSVAMIGVLAEIFVDTIYRHMFGHPLWRYNFLPVHHAYTSQFSPVLWGAFGFYLYLIHHEYEKWPPKKLLYLSIVFSLEAIMIEGAADLISKLFLGKLIYYYHPGNLWHLTSIQGIPFYFLTGVLIIQTIHWFKSSPHYFTFVSIWVTTITVFFK